jgi:LmeA-like phospholipid-binding
VPGPLPGATERIGTARANPQQPGYPPPPTPAGPPRGPVATPTEDPAKPKKKRRFRGPLAIFLVLILVFAVVVVGVIAAELFVRNEATKRVAQAAACVTQDTAHAKFSLSPLVLWQVITDHYTNLTVWNDGNQVKDAKGATLRLDVSNVQITNGPDSKGTVGSINATFTWTTKGIKDSIAAKVGKLARFVSNTVVAHPNDGTIELKGKLGDDMVVKPVISGSGIQFQITRFDVLGGLFSPKESAQSELDKYTSDATKNLPLGIHADNVEVTSDSMIAHFSTQNATIPAGGTTTPKDPCFAKL